MGMIVDLITNEYNVNEKIFLVYEKGGDGYLVALTTTNEIDHICPCCLSLHTKFRIMETVKMISRGRKGDQKRRTSGIIKEKVLWTRTNRKNSRAGEGYLSWIGEFDPLCSDYFLTITYDKIPEEVREAILKSLHR